MLGMRSRPFVDYNDTERIVQSFSWNFNVSMAIAVCGSFLMPVFVAGAHYLKGTYSAKVWFLPFPVS